MEHTSTGIATRPTQAIHRLADKNGKNVWKIITDEMLCRMIAESVHNMKITSIDSVTSNVYTEFIKSAIEENRSSNTANAIPSTIHSKQQTQPSTLPVNSRSPDPSLIPDQVMTHAIADTVSDDLIKSTWIHVTDSGGQPQFSDISRAFVRVNSVNVIAFKLTECLNQKPKFKYSINGKVLSQPSYLQMSNLELIQHFVHSIVSSKYMRSGIKLKPYVVILGTYLDHVKMKKQLPFQKLESLDDKNAVLLDALKEFKDHLIFFNEAAKELIFSVDNTCFINRKKISSDIRSHIMQHDLGFRVDIPFCCTYLN